MNDEHAAQGSPAILLVSPRLPELRSFAEILHHESRLPVKATSAGEALEGVRRGRIVLAVIDEMLGAEATMSVIKGLIEIDAFMHTAVLSDADEEAFHQRTEGLGVLARLPLMPEPEDARRLCGKLKDMLRH